MVLVTLLFCRVVPQFIRKGFILGSEYNVSIQREVIPSSVPVSSSDFLVIVGWRGLLDWDIGWIRRNRERMWVWRRWEGVGHLRYDSAR